MFESSDELDENVEEDHKMPRWLFTLFLAGFILALVGVVIAVVASLLGGGLVSGGVVVFIGPIPIVLGAGPGATWLVLTGVILTVLSVILFVVERRKMLKN